MIQCAKISILKANIHTQLDTDGISNVSSVILAAPSSTLMQTYFFSAMDLLSAITAPTAAAHAGTKLRIWPSSLATRHTAQDVSGVGIVRGRLRIFAMRGLLRACSVWSAMMD